MIKTKKSRLLVVGVVIFSMMAMYGYMPGAQAASLSDVSDTLSDSDLSASATHTVDFTTGVTIPASGYFEVVLHNDFGDIVVGNITCPGGYSATAPDTETARCTAAGSESAGAVTGFTVSSVTNPAVAGSYDVTITTYDDGAVELETAGIKVYIIDDVTVTAHVDASLTFAIGNVDAGQTINGVITNGTSTATTIPFETLSSAQTTTVAQSLAVSTNATDGFSVTVQQSDELTSAGGANINSFNNAQDNTGSTTPVAWAVPSGDLGDDYTYGHMGLTTNDSDLATDFTASKYAGLNNTDAMEVMSHNGPADGSTQDKGLASVAYTIGITDLQEAGDYSTTLTYICTPTY